MRLSPIANICKAEIAGPTIFFLGELALTPVINVLLPHVLLLFCLKGHAVSPYWDKTAQ
jgi:hypothetical protein